MKQQTEPEGTLFLVSTYTDNAILAHTPKGEQGAGIYAIYCSPDGKMLMKETSLLGPNVAFLLKHPSMNTVYATTECINQEGEILTTSFDSNTGKLTLQGKIAAQGKSTCYLNLHKSHKYLTAVNYWDAKLATFPVAQDGSVGQPLNVNMQPGAEYVEKNNPTREEHWKYRQRWPHTHCMVTEPYARDTSFVIDLGTDTILSYKVDNATGALHKTGTTKLTPHLGPRHIVFHPKVKTAYLVNELQSSVSVFKYNDKKMCEGGSPDLVESSTEKGSTLELIQTLSTLPSTYENNMSLNEHGVWKAASHSSEIRLHPSGKFLYIGNRGHDSIAIFSVEDASTGLLTLVDVCPSGGKTPRNFNFSSNGKHLLVGNQDSNNCTLFEIDAVKGSLSKISALPIPSPNYVYGIKAKLTASKATKNKENVVTATATATSKELAKQEAGDEHRCWSRLESAIIVFVMLWFLYAWLHVGHRFDL